MTKDFDYIKNLGGVYDDFKLWLNIYYGLETEILEEKPSSWGYSTSCYYLKAKDGDYAVSISRHSVKKSALIDKDIYISNLLKSVIPTPAYLQTNNKSNYIVKNAHIIKINEYINGVPPFEMNLIILKEAVNILKNIHSTLAPGIKLSSPKGLSKYEKKKFLHGDLTPSNILVSNNKIIGILDFEHCFIGPIEWDLARCLVFSWFRMYEKVTFEETLNLVLEVYGSDLVNKKLLLEFSIKNAQTYLHNIIKHKYKYEDKEWFKIECDFAKEKLKHIKTIKLE